MQPDLLFSRDWKTFSLVKMTAIIGYFLLLQVTHRSVENKFNLFKSEVDSPVQKQLLWPEQITLSQSSVEEVPTSTVTNTKDLDHHSKIDVALAQNEIIIPIRPLAYQEQPIVIKASSAQQKDSSPPTTEPPLAVNKAPDFSGYKVVNLKSGNTSLNSQVNAGVDTATVGSITTQNFPNVTSSQGPKEFKNLSKSNTYQKNYLEYSPETAPEQANTEVQQINPKLETCLKKKVGSKALQKSEPSFVVCEKIVTLEGIKGNTNKKWIEYRDQQKNHLTTLSYQRPLLEKFNQTVPLISFEKLAEIIQQTKIDVNPNLGMVFGELGPMIEVELSSRYDEIIYFNQNFEMVSKFEQDQKRWFLAMNVEPGSTVVGVQQSDNNLHGAIAVPVKEKTVTYLEIPELMVHSISGKVYLSTSQNDIGEPLLKIEVIGQFEKSTYTNDQGVFQINDVTTVGDYPLYVDVTNEKDGYKYRFKTSLLELNNKKYFILSEEQLKTIASQFENGLSETSSIAIGSALPTNAENKALTTISTQRAWFENYNLFPFQHSWLKQSPYRSESYTTNYQYDISDTKNLNTTQQPLFVTVQIPEGVGTEMIYDQSSGVVYWSQIIFSQPGVINMLEP